MIFGDFGPNQLCLTYPKKGTSNITTFSVRQDLFLASFVIMKNHEKITKRIIKNRVLVFIKAQQVF